MVQGAWQYGLYLVLYTAFWSAVSVILYRSFFLGGAAGLDAGLYFFLAGLVLLVGGAVRTLTAPWRDRRPKRDPVSASLGLSGVLAILYANLA